MPDIPLETAGGGTRVAELMRAARFVLLDLTSDSVVAAASELPALVRVVTARSRAKPGPADALLIRPDGYVAWAAGPGASDPAAGLNEALYAWFSPTELPGGYQPRVQ
jgi:hypothetical protein